MTLDQALAFALLGATIALFVWGRIAYDLVALASLFVGVLVGLVPAKHAFEGFSSEIVIIIAAALVVSEAIARSGVVESALRPALPYLRTTQTQVSAFSAAVLVLSMVTKNVGALAILMPVALQVARRTGTSAAALLMPMAFASLLGGTVTLVGTSPNIIVADVRQQLSGKPFGMFDFTPVGLCLALMGLVFLTVGWRLLPLGRRNAPSADAAFAAIEGYTLEARLDPGSMASGRTVAELEALGDGIVTVATIVRERFRRLPPRPDWILQDGDTLLLRGQPEDLEALIARAGLKLAGESGSEGEIKVVEGVITESSPLAGLTPAKLKLQERHRVGLLAVSRSGRSIVQRLAAVRLRVGDVVVLRGPADAMPDVLGTLRVLPLANRSIGLGLRQRSLLPAAVLTVAMASVAFHALPVSVAFFGAAVVLLLMRTMTMHEAYETVEWHILILLGALIPISHAVQTTGGTEILAGWLRGVVEPLPPLGALAVVLAITMFVTPFLHNAPTVLVVAPIATTLAAKIGVRADPFLMAVAVGAGCDFLTPIGHQCNTLVMGPGGYRFADYPRLGLPLSLLVIAAGVPLIAFFWPLR